MNYVITIGRQYGSGGRYIGRELAKKLNINFYDNELLEKVSENSGLCMDYVKENDEKKEGLFSFMGLNSNGNVYSAVQKVSLEQFKTIKMLADNQSCVIVGRCADYILKDHPHLIRIFICAPMDERIQRAIRYYNLEPKNAKETLLKMDKKRAGYYNYFTDQKWGLASNYDLCISSSIGKEKAVDLIIQFVEAKLNQSL